MNLIILDSKDENIFTPHIEFLNNKKKKRPHSSIKDASVNYTKLLFLGEKLKKNIVSQLKKIEISKKDKSFLKLNNEKTNKILFELSLKNKICNDRLLYLLIKLNTKFDGIYETQYLIRRVLDNCKSEIFFQILLYNYLYKIIYSVHAVYLTFRYLNQPRFVKKFFDFYNRNSSYFGNYFWASGRYIKKWEIVYEIFGRPKHEYKFIKGKDYYKKIKDIRKKLEPNELSSVLAKLRFADKHKREYDFNQEKDLVLVDYYHQKIREKYIGTYKWANEYFLYKNTQEIFLKRKVKVLREYSPKILHPQRLDIYFEYNDQKIAFEYQGEQHFKPIKFFGGLKAFKKRKKLDLRKERVCKKLNINLIKFNYDEPVKTAFIIKRLKENNIF